MVVKGISFFTVFLVFWRIYAWDTNHDFSATVLLEFNGKKNEFENAKTCKRKNRTAYYICIIPPTNNKTKYSLVAKVLFCSV